MKLPWRSATGEPICGHCVAMLGLSVVMAVAGALSPVGLPFQIAALGIVVYVVVGLMKHRRDWLAAATPPQPTFVAPDYITPHTWSTICGCRLCYYTTIRDLAAGRFPS